MCRRIAAVLFAVAAVAVTNARHPEPPANADQHRLFLPIVARGALVHRGPMTRWTAYARTRFHDLAVDANGVVFASTDDGVLRWDSVQGDHRLLTEADGLPHGPIGPIAVDGAGNLWLAAKPKETIADADATTGVRRLAPDGTVQAFTTAEGLAGNAVYAIAVDPTDRVWVAAWHGVSRREADGSWTTLRNPSPDLTCEGTNCWHTKLDIAFGGGSTWFGHAGGVTCLRGDGEWREWATDPVRRLTADRHGGGWAGDRGNFNFVRYDPEGSTRRVEARHSYLVRDLVVDAADRLWVGQAYQVESVGDDGLWRAEGGPAGLPADGLTRLFLDPSGRVWAALAGMIVRLDPDGGGPSLRVGLPLAGDRVAAIAPASDGSVWLGVGDMGSDLGGLVHVSRDGHWTSRTLEAGTPDPRGVGAVVVAADGTLFASNWYQLLRRGPDGTETIIRARAVEDRARFGRLVPDGEGTLWIGVIDDGEAVAGIGIAALRADGRWSFQRSGEGIPSFLRSPLWYDPLLPGMWFGGRGVATRRTDGTWRSVALPPGLVNHHVFRMAIDAEGRRWFMTGSKLWTLADDGEWTDRTAELDLAPDAPPPGFQTTALDPQGDLWVGTSSGLLRRQSDGRWERIAVPFAHPDAAWQSIIALAFDAAGRLWVGTEAGVARLE